MAPTRPPSGFSSDNQRKAGAWLAHSLAVVAWCVALAPRATTAAGTFGVSELAALDGVIQASIEQHRCPGAVVYIGRGDAAVYRKAYGLRRVEPTTAPMTVDTVFDLASLTKPIACATSILILADRGKIALDEPVAQYLPAFAANGKDKTTIRQLLLHVGGLPPDNDLADFADGPVKAMERTLATKPTWPADARFAYSDVGFIVLGELVRAVDGRALDRFAREEIFEPLGMRDTAYNPPAAWRSRCAPTQQRDGHWMLGEVHDPRAFALGGVAGHAGVFSTADDLAKWCRMILGRGAVGGKRILSEKAVAEMTRPTRLPGGAVRGLGLDIDTAYSGARGDRFAVGTTFGHTGFTGTSFWIDPAHDCFVILLTNSVHPAGKGDVRGLRRQVATLAAEAILGDAEPPATAPAAPRVLCGIDVLEREHFARLRGRRVGLITNHTGRDGAGRRTLDLLAAAEGAKVVCVFSPEHGLYGTVDAKIADAADSATGLKIYSLYGKTLKPTAAMLDGVDTLVYDIQDAGTRFYTYVSTLGLCMEAAAEHKLRFVVLDRPNPVAPLGVLGPLADEKHLSFIAYAPIPLVHGMTLGELARLFNDWRGERPGIGCDLDVVAMEGWTRAMWWDDTGLTWVNPSPNLRNPTQALLYPGIGLLEASNVSVGRGTDQPFETLGAPWMDGRALAAALNREHTAGVAFVPVEFTPTSSKFANELCRGCYVTVTDRRAIDPVRVGLSIAWQLRQQAGDKFDFGAVERMLQNADAMAALRQADTPARLAQVPATWEQAMKRFEQVLAKHLLY